VRISNRRIPKPRGLKLLKESENLVVLREAVKDCELENSIVFKTAVIISEVCVVMKIA